MDGLKLTRLVRHARADVLVLLIVEQGECFDSELRASGVDGVLDYPVTGVALNDAPARAHH